MDNQWSMEILTIFIAGLLIQEAEPIKITSVEIPSVVRAGTEEPTILDCKYDMESTSNVDLVVKWYVNNELLYQWIHARKPMGSDEFRKYIDETYKASNDSNMMYRAVKLVRPGHELSGKIRCSISARDGEDEASREMLVYAPEKVFRLSHPTMNEDMTQLTTTCLAEDVYPRPIVTLHRDNQSIVGQEVFYKNQSNGRFSVETVANLSAEKIKLPTIFRCEVSMQAANYTSIREYVYNGGSLSRVSLVFFFIITALITRTTSISYSQEDAI